MFKAGALLEEGSCADEPKTCNV